MKFHRKGPAMFLFRILRKKKLIPSKTLVAMATKLKSIGIFKVFLSETNRPMATKVSMGLHQVSSNYSPVVKFDHAQGVTSFTWGYIEKILEIFLYLPIRPRVTKFYMWFHLVGLYQKCQNYSPCIKLVHTHGFTSFT